MLGKGQLPIFITNIAYLAIFSLLFLSRKNYEFIIYIGVIVLILLLILWTNSKVKYSNSTLWGLTLWGMLHMLGGGVYINGTRLYEVLLLPISAAYPILKYDQFVHIIGFGVATLVMWELLEPILKNEDNWVRIGIIVVMAGLGVGALNELLEFLATVIVPETGVGGYVNTSLDLVADLVGAVIALMVIKAGKNGLRMRGNSFPER